MHNARDPFNLGYGGTEPSPVVSHSSSFNWGVLAVAATFIIAAVLVATAVAYVGRNRSNHRHVALMTRAVRQGGGEGRSPLPSTARCRGEMLAAA